jgi:hypothetical protein
MKALMIVKSADPTIHEGASLKMLNEIETLLANGGYTLKFHYRMQWSDICILVK